jgi:type IV pilus assembly protein PilA
MTEPHEDLEGARRRVQRFGIALLSLAVAASGVKLIDFLVARSERNHQEECLENLRAICFAERMAQAKGQPFASHVSELPAPIPEGNRFAYFLGTGPLEDRAQDAGASPPQATGVGVDPHGWQVPPGMKQLVAVSDLPSRFFGGVPLGASGTCPGPTCQFVAACAGNLDVDDDLDVWSVSTAPRESDGGSSASPCEPVHERADLQ